MPARDYGQVVEQQETIYDFGRGVVIAMPVEQARVLKEDIKAVIEMIGHCSTKARLAMLVADLDKETR